VDLVERRHSEAFGFRTTVATLLDRRSVQDKMPREYQIVRTIIALLQRSPAKSLKPAIRRKILALLNKSGGANSGEAALLLYALNKEQGLKQLRASLSGKIPAAHNDSVAGCLLLGTPEAQDILVEALENPNLQIQHAAACALGKFPTAEAREVATRWRARQ